MSGWLSRKCVYSDVALVQMCVNVTALEKRRAVVAGGIHIFRRYRTLGDEHIHRSTLRFVVLLGDIQNSCADHLCDIAENVGQTFRVVLLINISDVILFFPLCLCITYVKNVKAQRFGEIVKPI